MTMILPPCAKTENRLLCSDCRNRNGGDDGLQCFFEEYTTPPDPNKAEKFELRDQAGTLESRVSGPSRQWRPYVAGNVFCIGCLEHSRGSNYVIFNPRTREQIQP